MILTTLILIPLIGALVVGLVPRPAFSRWASLALSALVFFLSLPLYTGFDQANGAFQFEEQGEFLSSFGASYHLGLDGISLWLVILTAFLSPLVVLGSFNTIQKNQRGYYACLLLLESAMIGAFLALDGILFYIFWELMLVPMFFIIGLWGGENRIYATVKFVLFTLVGSLLMLVALLYLGHMTGSFDYAKWAEFHVPEDVQIWCFLAFALAFLIKVPLVPFHTWLPDAHTEAPAGGSVLLAGVLLKMGTYGLLRFCIPIFPEAAKAFAPLLIGLAVLGIVHGALAAAVQPDMKRLVAYSSVSHMGFIVLGLFTFTLEGFQGSLLQMVNHGLSTGALFFLVGMVYDQRHTRLIGDYGGIAKVVPLFSAAFLFTALASAGLPGLNGFVGEFLVLSSAYTVSPWAAAIGVSGIVLGAWYLFSLYSRVFLGPLKNPANQKLKDLSLREGLVLIPLLALMLFIGVKPNFFLEPMEKTLQLKVLERLKPPPTLTDFAAEQRRLQDIDDPPVKKKKRNER